MPKYKLTWQYDARAFVTESLVCDFPEGTTEADIQAMSLSDIFNYAANEESFVQEDVDITGPLDTYEDLSGAAAEIEPWEDTQDDQ